MMPIAPHDESNSSINYGGLSQWTPLHTLEGSLLSHLPINDPLFPNNVLDFESMPLFLIEVLIIDENILRF